MSFLSTSLLALSMSADAFAVSLGKGAALRKPSLKQAMKIAFVFGATEGSMPLLGWAAGLAAATIINSFDHWIAFFILNAIGLKMIHACVFCCETEGHPQEPDHANPQKPPQEVALSNWIHPQSFNEVSKKEKSPRKKQRLLFLSAIATSLDSMAVGVSLAFIEANIFVTALAIGAATFVMSTLAIMIGHAVGQKIGNIAEGLGGLCLIFIGFKILNEHTHLFF